MIGRADVREGDLAPYGLRWGYVCSFPDGRRLERYLMLRFRAPFLRAGAPVVGGAGWPRGVYIVSLDGRLNLGFMLAAEMSWKWIRGNWFHHHWADA